MTASVRRTLGLKVLVVDDELDEESAAGRAVRSLVAKLERRDFDVVHALVADDAKASSVRIRPYGAFFSTGT